MEPLAAVPVSQGEGPDLTRNVPGQSLHSLLRAITLGDDVLLGTFVFHTGTLVSLGFV